MSKFDENQDLCAYIYAAEVYDHGKNIFDSFIPLIEGVLNLTVDHPSISFLLLHSKINETYKVQMPKATLQKLLQKMALEKKIEFKDKKYITINGENFDSDYWSTRNASECNIQDVFLSYQLFLAKKQIEIDFEQAKYEICNFVFRYCNEILSFVAKNREFDVCSDDLQDLHINELLDFLIECKKNNTENYQSIMKLYCGATQATFLNFKLKELDELQKDSLNITNVILDSNFLMRVLDIQTENECLIALETLDALKQLHINMFAHKISIKEVSGSIRNFLNETEAYSTYTKDYFKNQSIRMSGLLSALQRGKTRAFLFDLSRYSKLEARLKYLGIQIIGDDEEKSLNQETIQSLILYKNKDTYNYNQAFHDVFLIDYCRRMRKKGIETFAEAEWWVITNDIKLVRWNQEQSNNSLQECITEAQISNLLWLKTEKKDNNGLVSTVITLASGNSISSENLIHFIDNMQKYKESKNEQPEELDQVSLVFATDSITTRDIQAVNSKTIEVDDLVEKKIVLYDLDKEKSDKEHEREKEKAQRQFEKLSLEKEIDQFDYNKDNIRNKLNQAKEEKNQIQIRIRNLRTIKDLYVQEGKKLSGKLLERFALITLIFVVIFIYFSPSLNIDIKNNITGIFKTILLGTSSSVILSIILFFVSAIKTGAPKNCKEYFLYRRNSVVNDYKNKLGIACGEENEIPKEIAVEEQKIGQVDEKIDGLDRDYKDVSKELLLKRDTLINKYGDISA